MIGRMITTFRSILGGESEMDQPRDGPGFAYLALGFFIAFAVAYVIQASWRLLMKILF